MNKILIGLTGPIGVGKDTVASMIANGYDGKKMAFADPVKAIAQIAFSLTPEWLTDDYKNVVHPRHEITPRQMFTSVGTDLFVETYGPAFWIVNLSDRAQQCVEDVVVVSDVRNITGEDAEAKWIRSEGGVIIHVAGPMRRPGPAQFHKSEQGVEMEEGDLLLQNTGDAMRLRKGLAPLMRYILERHYAK